MGSDRAGVQGSGSFCLGAVGVRICGALAGLDVVLARFARSAVSISHRSNTSAEQCEDREELLSGTRLQSHKHKVQEGV